MKKYYLHDGQAQQGPFSIEELKEKQLSKATPIWFDGIENWTTVGEVEALKEIVNVPPPFVPTPPKQHTAVKTAPPKRSNLGRVLIYLSIIALVLLCVFLYNAGVQKNDELKREERVNAEEDNKAEIKNNITSYVTADRSAYNYSELGGISNLSITVSNNTDYLMDNVKVKIDYIKPDGDIWDSKIVDFNMIDPQTQTTIKVPDTERGVKVEYQIIEIQSKVLGL